jgi:hypothetical protein
MIDVVEPAVPRLAKRARFVLDTVIDLYRVHATHYGGVRMSNLVPADPENRTRRLMGVAGIAALFEVTPNTVGAWISRADRGELDPIPPADVEIPTARPDGQTVRGWEPSRAAEWRAWRANLPGRGWRKGRSGERRYTTHQHIGKRPGRTHKEETP